MNLNTLTFFVCLLLAIAFVLAVPADESLPGDVADDKYNSYDPQSFFKLKKLKKLLLG